MIPTMDIITTFQDKISNFQTAKMKYLLTSFSRGVCKRDLDILNRKQEFLENVCKFRFLVNRMKCHFDSFML